MKPRDDKKIERIYKSTLGLAREYGLAGLTMSKIAKESGLATGTLYIYFPGKDELINALYTECRKSSASTYFTGFDEALPFKAGFKIIWTNLLRFRTESFDEALFLDQCYHSPFITESTRDMTRQLFQPLYKLMDRGKDEGLVKTLDSVLLLTFIVGSIQGMVKYLAYIGHEITDETAEAAFNLCWDGIKA